MLLEKGGQNKGKPLLLVAVFGNMTETKRRKKKDPSAGKSTTPSALRGKLSKRLVISRDQTLRSDRGFVLKRGWEGTRKESAFLSSKNTWQGEVAANYSLLVLPGRESPKRIPPKRSGLFSARG